MTRNIYSTPDHWTTHHSVSVIIILYHCYCNYLYCTVVNTSLPLSRLTETTYRQQTDRQTKGINE